MNGQQVNGRDDPPPDEDDSDEDADIAEARGGVSGFFGGSIDRARWTISFRAGVVLAGMAVVWVVRMTLQIIHEIVEMLNHGIKK